MKSKILILLLIVFISTSMTGCFLEINLLEDGLEMNLDNKKILDINNKMPKPSNEVDKFVLSDNKDPNDNDEKINEEDKSDSNVDKSIEDNSNNEDKNNNSDNNTDNSNKDNSNKDGNNAENEVENILLDENEAINLIKDHIEAFVNEDVENVLSTIHFANLNERNSFKESYIKMFNKSDYKIYIEDIQITEKYDTKIVLQTNYIQKEILYKNNESLTFFYKVSDLDTVEIINNRPVITETINISKDELIDFDETNLEEDI